RLAVRRAVATAAGDIGLAACRSAAPAAPTSAPAPPKPTSPPAAPTTAAAAPTTVPASAAKPTTAAAPAAAPTVAPAVAPAAAGAGGSLAYGLSFDVDDTLDPQVTNFDSTIRITLNVCEPLVWEPEPGQFVPGLAGSWEVTPGAMAYTFQLKKGVKFRDGTPVTAEAAESASGRVV